MFVLHAPTEIAGQMGLLCGGLRSIGIRATGYNWFQSYIQYNENIINTDAFELAHFAYYLTRDADVLHFHNGDTLTVGHTELPALKAMGKKMVMHHWGGDVRAKWRTRQLNPYELTDAYFPDEEIDRHLRQLSEYIPTAIVQDYELYPYVKDYYQHVHVLPLACNVKQIAPVYPDPGRVVPLVLHAPTNREFKGSKYVEQAVERLRPMVPFEFQLIEHMPHARAMEIYAHGDIIVDQLLSGTYGMLSVEAMALGKVVVAYVRDDVRAHLPADFPIVVATPENLADVLLPLLHNAQLRHDIGKRSRAFVEQFHAVDRVAQQLLEIYRTL
ncbi:glycosyltransferase [Alicyclobacillus macrosporangiidus]|uniref:Glycosyltransferase involved in cell wall bisynthesis n=1 Tax=Alicyclobacillus macrosporangiidus TaxID=392015 RepID=A0A1I7F0W9_9BACL|nr:glycosyltransferase [Alicyclobacillus macrosporangiidus]SFU29794.1 Glycosyltransferase involved in cell wall bisynthesis [Alicyclobacillus macrosporangiidus]